MDVSVVPHRLCAICVVLMADTWGLLFYKLRLDRNTYVVQCKKISHTAGLCVRMMLSKLPLYLSTLRNLVSVVAYGMCNYMNGL